jgi:hypothetical protein
MHVIIIIHKNFSVKVGLNTKLTQHYNKRCPCTPSDFIGFWMNSLVVMNKDQWRSSEFTGLVNGD